MNACRWWSRATGYCGSTDGVRLYLAGRRCTAHTPHPVTPAPDPLRTYAALAELQAWRAASDRAVSEHAALRSGRETGHGGGKTHVRAGAA